MQKLENRVPEAEPTPGETDTGDAAKQAAQIRFGGEMRQVRREEKRFEVCEREYGQFGADDGAEGTGINNQQPRNHRPATATFPKNSEGANHKCHSIKDAVIQASGIARNREDMFRWRLLFLRNANADFLKIFAAHASRLQT